MKRFYAGVACALLSAVGFGLMPVFALFAYRYGVSTPTVLFWRFTLASLCFFLYVGARARIQLTGRQVICLFALGGLYVLQATCYFTSIKFIPASLTALVLYTYPVLVALLSGIVEKDRLTGRVWASLGISFAGLTMVLGTSFGILDPRGILWAFGAATVYCCYIVLGNRVVDELPPAVTSAFVALFASLWLLGTALPAGGIAFAFPAQAWPPMAGIVLFSTVLGVFAFFCSLELIGATRASILSMVEPLVTIAFAGVLFGERLAPLQLAGGAAVLSGAMLVVLARDAGGRAS